jgi:hypothetical protein
MPLCEGIRLTLVPYSHLRAPIEKAHEPWVEAGDVAEARAHADAVRRWGRAGIWRTTVALVEEDSSSGSLQA